ncbi:HAD-superfamily hydrolase, partial [Coemansia reversa NRRL 1564]
AVAFDIDGVLVRGKHALDEGRRALRILNGDNALNKRIPFVLMTNGGGVSEASKAADISRLMGVEIDARQVVLSHSPMQGLAARYSNDHVLVVGGSGHRCADIARAYGFRNVSTPNDVVAWRPSAWQFMRPPEGCQLSDPGLVRDYARDPFRAVMMLHDSFDFGRDLQIVTDVLRSRDATLGAEFINKQSVPLYLSNADLIFSNEYPQPRFAQGAFHVCLRAMWDALTGGAPLEHTRFGKPFTVQYDFVERLLDQLALRAVPSTDVAQLRNERRVYAIGDNPAADIAGANGAGWTSVLVRTGVFNGGPGTNDPANPATMVVNHVEDAVGWIVAAE